MKLFLLIIFAFLIFSWITSLILYSKRKDFKRILLINTLIFTLYSSFYYFTELIFFSSGYGFMKIAFFILTVCVHTIIGFVLSLFYSNETA